MVPALLEKKPHRVLYSGAPLAGVTASVCCAARALKTASDPSPRLGFEIMTSSGVPLHVHSDIRTPYYFESAAAGLACCSAADANEQLRWLKPRFQAHIEYLQVIDGIVFVVDSQPQRSEANIERLDMLRHDLVANGRAPEEIPLLFQCNKRDLPNTASMSEIERALRWPLCAYVPSVSIKGAGVMSALRMLLSMSPNTASD